MKWKDENKSANKNLGERVKALWSNFALYSWGGMYPWNEPLHASIVWTKQLNSVEFLIRSANILLEGLVSRETIKLQSCSLMEF